MRLARKRFFMIFEIPFSTEPKRAVIVSAKSDGISIRTLVVFIVKCSPFSHRFSAWL